MADAGEVFGSVSDSDGAGILVKGDIEHPMEAASGDKLEM